MPYSVKYLQEDGQPPLQEGERDLLYDADGLEVEAWSDPDFVDRCYVATANPGVVTVRWYSSGDWYPSAECRRCR